MNVQLILVQIKGEYIYCELDNDTLVVGAERAIYHEDIDFQALVSEEWREYAVGRTFRILLPHANGGITLSVDDVRHAATTHDGYIMPLFTGRLEKTNIAFTWEMFDMVCPKLLTRPVLRAPQPPIVGKAPRALPPSKELPPPTTFEQWQQEQQDATQTPAEKELNDSIVRDFFAEA